MLTALLAAAIGYCIASAQAPVLQTAAIVTLYGATAGSWSVPLALDGASHGTETRSGADHWFVFHFDKYKVSSNAVIDEGVAVVGTPTFLNSEMTVPLIDVLNTQ
ncbi:MAG TPA: hypothetical protein PLW68_11735 [Casimicrobiaceae bacterium]|nr:hypothetical protein [Casimicrobiaceae bacterium]